MDDIGSCPEHEEDLYSFWVLSLSLSLLFRLHLQGHLQSIFMARSGTSHTAERFEGVYVRLPDCTRAARGSSIETNKNRILLMSHRGFSRKTMKC